MNNYNIYEMHMFSDMPKWDKKIAVFYNKTLAIQFVEYMGSCGERYGVFDSEGNRIDEE